MNLSGIDKTTWQRLQNWAANENCSVNDLLNQLLDKREQVNPLGAFQMEQLISELALAVAVFDTEMRYLQANEAWREQYSLGDIDIIGKSHYDIFPEIGEGWKAIYQRCMQGEINSNNCDPFPRPDGTLDLVRWQVRPWYLDHEYKSIGGIMMITEVISEQKQAEQSLIESVARYRQMFTKNQAIKLLTDPDTGKIVDANPAASEFYGYSIDVLKTMKVSDINILSEAEIYQEMQRAKEETKVFFEFQHRLASGEIRDVEVHSGAIEIQGKPILYSIIIDVTKRKQAERSLLEVNERFRLAFQTSPDAININRMKDGMYIDINTGFTSIMGYTREEVVGKTSLELNIWHNPDDRKKLLEPLQEKGYCENLEAEFKAKSGEIKIGLMSARVISLDNVPCIISITRDITEYRNLELQAQEVTLLRIKLEKERELVALKDRILSIMSHDFRTPLTVIQSASDILDKYHDKISPERHSKSLEQIQQQVSILNKMIDDILIVGRGRAGKTDFRPSKLDLVQFCGIVFEQVQLADETEHQFQFIKHKDLLEVQADSSLLQHILMNLLSNAIKYSPKNSQITLELDASDTDAIFMIADKGIGIPKVEMANLFEPFHRAGNVGDIKGTGLGLSIVKQYVELHNGSVEVKSEIGKGTEFKVKLPLASTAFNNVT